MYTIKEKLTSTIATPLEFYSTPNFLKSAIQSTRADKQLQFEKKLLTNDEFVVPIIKTDGAYFKPLRAGKRINQSHSYTQERKFIELTYEWIDNAGELAAKARTVHVLLIRRDG